jgi:signal transduction histidine kinase/DNA-binding response OmpR family regulator
MLLPLAMALASFSSEALPATLADAHAEIRALRAALAEQQRLALIPIQNPNPIFRLGPGRRVLFANPAAETLVQRSSAEELEQGWVVLEEWVIKALASGDEARYEASLSKHHFAAFVVPVVAEQYVNLYLIDTTEHIKAQQYQAEQQAFTQQVLDTSPSLVYVRDSEGNTLFENTAMRALRDQARLPTTYTNSELAAIQAQQRAHYAAADAQVLATGKEVTAEDPLTLPTGVVRWYHTVKKPLAWAGNVPHVLGVSTDVTELKLATEAATAAARARENFLANMSHEIRTPLNGVLGMAMQLSKTRLDPRQRELVQIIRSSGQHLLGVINDVLDMAKISSGKLELAQEAFNLCDSMGQAVQPLVLQAQEKGIAVEGTLLRNSCPYPWVIGDAHRLNQILINLVSNAIKFTPAGGRIAVGGYLLHDTDETLTVEFRVSDSGVGIAPEKVERIFESFTQAYADTARHFGGTGLGLSISRALVEQMGGTLKVESEVGKGSTFSFQLTLPRATAVAPTEEAAYDTGALRGKRLLLLEDNEINRAVARLLLEEWGVELDEAEDGPSGLAQFQQHTYDAVLMDIQMPGMNGLQVTAAIRRHADPQRANVPILALTANAFRTDTEQYLAAGMNDCIAKPFDEAELFAKLVALVTETAPPYDLAPLRALSRGNEAFVYRIVRSFLNNMPASLTDLRAALLATNWPEVARLVHHIKPNLAALGMTDAAPKVAELENLRQLELSPTETAQARATAAVLIQLVERALQALPKELPAA